LGQKKAAGQSAAVPEPAGQYVPAAQLLMLVPPLQKNPTVQVTHVLALVMPVTVDQVPAGHRSSVVLLMQ